MDPNDFFGTRPALHERVRDYLILEWIVDLDDYPHNIQEKALQAIDEMGANHSVPQIAGKIAMEILPI